MFAILHLISPWWYIIQQGDEYWYTYPTLDVSIDRRNDLIPFCSRIGYSMAPGIIVSTLLHPNGFSPLPSFRHFGPTNMGEHNHRMCLPIFYSGSSVLNAVLSYDRSKSTDPHDLWGSVMLPGIVCTTPWKICRLNHVQVRDKLRRIERSKCLTFPFYWNPQCFAHSKSRPPSYSYLLDTSRFSWRGRTWTMTSWKLSDVVSISSTGRSPMPLLESQTPAEKSTCPKQSKAPMGISDLN